MFKKLLYILAIGTISYIYAMHNKNGIKKILSEMVEEDQSLRKKFEQLNKSKNLVQQMKALNKQHIQRLKIILSQYYWITISEFSKEADEHAWLLVQHADDDLDFQKEILRKLEQLYPLGETNHQNFAYLYDRVAKNEGRPQKYGTQMQIIEGKWQPYEIEDLQNLEARRASIGLSSFQNYIDYYNGK